MYSGLAGDILRWMLKGLAMSDAAERVGPMSLKSGSEVHGGGRMMRVAFDPDTLANAAAIRALARVDLIADAAGARRRLDGVCAAAASGLPCTKTRPTQRAGRAQPGRTRRAARERRAYWPRWCEVALCHGSCTIAGNALTRDGSASLRRARLAEAGNL